MDTLEITYKGEVDEIPYEDFISSLQEEIEYLKKTPYTIYKDKQILRIFTKGKSLIDFVRVGNKWALQVLGYKQDIDCKQVVNIILPDGLFIER